VFVLAPRSIKFAPSETTPSGILKSPDATPDKIERIVPTSLSSVSCFLSMSPKVIPLGLSILSNVVTFAIFFFCLHPEGHLLVIPLFISL
jgi:hypothetical protein